LALDRTILNGLAANTHYTWLCITALIAMIARELSKQM